MALFAHLEQPVDEGDHEPQPRLLHALEAPQPEHDPTLVLV